jgi:hypothetical protein
MIDNEFMWMTANSIFDNYLCEGIANHARWFGGLKYAMERGLVFRMGREWSGWRPGVMNRVDNKWVWGEKSLEELRGYGIELVRVSFVTDLSVSKC